MCVRESPEIPDNALKAREYCERLATVLHASVLKAKELGDIEMVDRLTAAKAAADRAIHLLAAVQTILKSDETGQKAVS